MHLRPYNSNDFDTIQKWSTDARTHAMWSANILPYPLELTGFEKAMADVAVKWGDTPFVAEADNGKIIGFFSFSLNHDTKEAMLKFVIIDSKMRGKGYGREMLELAVKYAFEEKGAEAVQLNVFAENTGARKCYTKAGFTDRSVTENVFSFKDEKWSRCNMVAVK